MGNGPQDYVEDVVEDVVDNVEASDFFLQRLLQSVLDLRLACSLP